MLLSAIPRRGASCRGPRIPVPRLVSARTAGSVPRLQAQVADLRNALENTSAHAPPVFHTRPIHEPTLLTTVRPVTTNVPQNQDEFWRKVPVWSDVSAKEFLSYSWSVSPPEPLNAGCGLCFSPAHARPQNWSKPSRSSTPFCRPFSRTKCRMTGPAPGLRLAPSLSTMSLTASQPRPWLSA